MSDPKPVMVTLGDLHDHAEARVRSGAYASISDVVQAGLRALDREDEARDRWMRDAVQEALTDPRPSIPAEDVFAELRAHHRSQTDADGGGL